MSTLPRMYYYCRVEGRWGKAHSVCKHRRCRRANWHPKLKVLKDA